MGRPVYGLDSRLSSPGRHIGVSHSKRSKRRTRQVGQGRVGVGVGAGAGRDRAGLG